MIFTSWAFATFLTVVMAGLALLPTRSLRQLLILVASAYFYAYWKPAFVLLIMAPAIIDYWCAIRIEDSPNPRRRKFWLIASIVLNLGLLVYFKYTNFFLGTVSSLTGISIRNFDIVLPIGISFFTFKTMSYTIDVYRGELKASRRLWQYAMFVMYFPELVAGPVVRASVFLPQMTRSLRPSWARTVVGGQLILLGVTKKVVVADRLAAYVDTVFRTPAAYSPLTVLASVIAYSIQIYCDFSGYSDIAIGVSRIIGFDLPENFNMPYLSTSITEFWRRWHMTLSSWLRDYLYIPLGGNRKGPIRTYVNLILTMLLGGLWHGASWTFVFWGLLHGSYLAIHKIWTHRFGSNGAQSPLTKFFGWVLTFSAVNIAWVFFRAQDFGTAVTILRKVTGLAPGGVQWQYSPLFLIIPLVICAHALGLLALRQAATSANRRVIAPPLWAARWYRQTGSRFAIRPHRAAGVYALLPLPTFMGAMVLTLWLEIVVLFAMTQARPFIYFQF